MHCLNFSGCISSSHVTRNEETRSQDWPPYSPDLCPMAFFLGPTEGLCNLEGDERYGSSAASDHRILHGATAMGEFAQKRARNKFSIILFSGRFNFKP
jgi:hypothetical protein